MRKQDFGYRNYKNQGRFAAGKPRIDNKFKSDMNAQCENEGNDFQVAACKGVADVYYRAVVEFGTKRAVEFEGKLKRTAVAEEVA